MARVGSWIAVTDTMQRGYRYKLVAPAGRSFAEGFAPRFSPAEMLRLGVFEGKYMTDCRAEFPASWFKGAKLSETADPTINCFGVKSRLPLSEWRRKGWIIGHDPRGGSSGIAAIGRAGAILRSIRSRSAAGGHSRGMRRRCAITVSRTTSRAAHVSARHCCSGLTILSYERRNSGA